MISVYLECDSEQRDALVAELHERGTLGVLELESGLRAWFDSGVYLDDLIRRFDGEAAVEEARDWVRCTQESFPPVEIGKRFWLVPPWSEDPVPQGRMRLEINPGTACGTGWHPCTRLCLEAMERHVRPGDAVLDVGTGSGILSVAADLLGAARAIGCDIDLEAVSVARDRLRGRVFAGTADAVRGAAFDIVVANISGLAVAALLPELRRVCRDVLILSGFTSIPDIAGAAEVVERDGWRCVVVRYRPNQI